MKRTALPEDLEKLERDVNRTIKKSKNSQHEPVPTRTVNSMDGIEYYSQGMGLFPNFPNQLNHLIEREMEIEINPQLPPQFNFHNNN